MHETTSMIVRQRHRAAIVVGVWAALAALSGCATGDRNHPSRSAAAGTSATASQPEEGSPATAQTDFVSGQAGSMAEQDARATASTPAQPREKPRPNPIQQSPRRPVDQPRIR